MKTALQLHGLGFSWVLREGCEGLTVLTVFPVVTSLLCHRTSDRDKGR